MKRLLNIIAIFAIFSAFSACDFNKPLTVSEVYENGEKYEGKVITVTGKIDHVCRHSNRRMTIVDADGIHDMKINFGEELPPLNNSVAGKQAIATGKLIPSKMDLEEIKKYKEYLIEHHKDMDPTEHSKQEEKFFDDIIRQFENGEIEYYTHYEFEADSYEIAETE